MTFIATITGKRQLTIPADLFNYLSLKNGQKVVISENNGSIIIFPTQNLVNRLAASVSIPDKYKSLSPDQIIQAAKNEYFHQKSS